MIALSELQLAPPLLAHTSPAVPLVKLASCTVRQRPIFGGSRVSRLPGHEYCVFAWTIVARPPASHAEPSLLIQQRRSHVCGIHLQQRHAVWAAAAGVRRPLTACVQEQLYAQYLESMPDSSLLPRPCRLWSCATNRSRICSSSRMSQATQAPAGWPDAVHATSTRL